MRPVVEVGSTCMHTYMHTICMDLLHVASPRLRTNGLHQRWLGCRESVQKTGEGAGEGSFSEVAVFWAPCSSPCCSVPFPGGLRLAPFRGRQVSFPSGRSRVYYQIDLRLRYKVRSVGQINALISGRPFHVHQQRPCTPLLHRVCPQEVRVKDDGPPHQLVASEVHAT